MLEMFIDFEQNQNGHKTRSDHETRRGKNDLIRLDVGGQGFHSTVHTLTADIEPTSLLGEMVVKHLQQSNQNLPDRENLTKNHPPLVIDRDPEFFRLILNYLRNDGHLLIPDEYAQLSGLLNEARYFKMNRLECLVEDLINERKNHILERNNRLQTDDEQYLQNITFTSYNDALVELTVPALILPSILLHYNKFKDHFKVNKEILTKLFENVRLTWPSMGPRVICTTNLDSIKTTMKYFRKFFRLDKGFYCNQFIVVSPIFTRTDLIANLRSPEIGAVPMDRTKRNKDVNGSQSTTKTDVIRKVSKYEEEWKVSLQKILQW